MTPEPEPRVAALRSAGIVSRVIAALIDVAMVFGFQVGLYLVVVLVRLALDVRALLAPDGAWIWGTSTYFLLAVVYLTVSWSAFGRTVGQLIMGLGVISRRSGDNPRFVVALGRAVFCAVFPIGLLWVVISARRWSVQDIVCFTRVVYTHEVLPEPSVVHHVRGGT